MCWVFLLILTLICEKIGGFIGSTFSHREGVHQDVQGKQKHP